MKTAKLYMDKTEKKFHREKVYDHFSLLTYKFKCISIMTFSPMDKMSELSQ